MVCWYITTIFCSENSCLLIYPPDNVKDCTPSLRTAAAQSGSSGESLSIAAAVVIPFATVMLVVIISVIALFVYFFKKKKVKDTDLTR